MQPRQFSYRKGQPSGPKVRLLRYTTVHIRTDAADVMA